MCFSKDSCLCHVSGMLVSEFEEDLTAISSCSDENDLSKLREYLTVGRGKVVLQLLSITGIAVCRSGLEFIRCSQKFFSSFVAGRFHFSAFTI